MDRPAPHVPAAPAGGAARRDWRTLTGGSTALAGRVVLVAAALLVFLLGLRLLVAAAGGAGTVLEALHASGPVGLLGAGWLAAGAALSGSPVAAMSLTLLDGGVIGSREAVAMLAGSRFGASTIVLAAGFLAYLRGHRGPDAVYVGVISLVTTATIYVPATALALWLVGMEAVADTAARAPTGPAGVSGAVDPVVRASDSLLPVAGLFALGVVTLLGAFWLFDRALPRLDPPSPRVEAFVRRLGGARASFLVGAAVTSVTMSVAVSVTMLVPLSLKGVVRREQLVPYIMGANITTFVDTMFAAVLLDHPLAPAVVLAQVLGVGAVSVVVLAGLFRPYSAMVHAVAGRMVGSRRTLALSLAAWALVPVALVAVGAVVPA